MAQPNVRFYDWPYSPFCIKVRAILDYKQVAYERIQPLGQALLAIKRKGRIGKVPAIELDGEMIVDSTDIAYALDKRFPEPPILPAGERERGLCHALEDWADESLYFIGLYYRWHDLEGRKPIPLAFGKTLFGRAAYLFYLRRILGQIRGQGTSRKPADHVRRDLGRHIETIEVLLDPGPYTLGDKPLLCDFALFGQLTYLARTPVGETALADRPRIKTFLDRMLSPT